MKVTTKIWGLWDCEELLSVHLTQDDARDARDEHLGRCRCYADDQDVIGAAVEIRAIRLAGGTGPVENRNLPTSAVQDDAAHGREGESPRLPVPRLPVVGPRHADC